MIKINFDLEGKLCHLAENYKINIQISRSLAFQRTTEFWSLKKIFSDSLSGKLKISPRPLSEY